MNCQCCSKPLSCYQKKFCSRSCSAKTVQLGIKLTAETKQKISSSIKAGISSGKIPRPDVSGDKNPSYGKYRYKTNICTFCNVPFLTRNSAKKTCSQKCLLEIRMRNAKGIRKRLYKGIYFDSNYEVELAKLLDTRQIEWVAFPDPISWIDSKNKQRLYFPDFYIPAYNVYLDPKNPFVISEQAEKLSAITKLVTLLYGEPNDIMEHLTGLEPACYPVNLSTRS